MGRYTPTGGLVDETVWLGDLPVAVLTPAGQYYIAPDHLGAPHQITDSGKNTIWYWDDDPWCNGAATGNYPLRFPGQFNDSQTGTNYNYFRDYDPNSGRYFESDPIGISGGTNTYDYVEGKPADPRGTCPECAGAAVGGREKARAVDDGGWAGSLKPPLELCFLSPRGWRWGRPHCPWDPVAAASGAA